MTAAPASREPVDRDAPRVQRVPSGPTRTPARDAEPVDGRVALTIGVTGHRRLADADLVLYRRCIESFFDLLHARYPSTPLRILSALAEGADRLPVEIALARGYEVAAVLPLAVDEYERDFDDRIPAFRSLLARIAGEDVFVLPPIPVPASFVASEMTARAAYADSPRDGHRDTHYQQAGDFVAAHCHVLLALWDGVDNDLPGGTGEVVRYKLTGRGPHAASVTELQELPDSGAVAWVRVRRAGEARGAVDEAEVGVLTWLYPDGRPEAQFQTIFERIDAFNRTVAVGQEFHIDGRSPKSIVPDEANLALDREQRAVLRTFAAADTLSNHYRRLGDRVLVATVTGGCVMAVAYEVWSRLLPSRALLGLYLGAFACVCGVHLWHRSVRTLHKHLDYRALAEGLRVRFFWSLAGVSTNVTDVYMRQQNDELQWIREALRPSTPPRRRPAMHVELVFDAWVADQSAYFAASARRLDRMGRTASWIAAGFIAAGLLETIAMFALSASGDGSTGPGFWRVATIGSLPIVGALVASLAGSMGYRTRAKRHATLAGVFSRASAACATVRARAGDHTAALQALLDRLGREALFENQDWLTLRRDRPVVLPDEVDRT